MMLLKFTKSNCIGCVNLSKALSETEHDFEIVEYDLETEQGMDVAMQYGVMSAPVLIRIEEGNETDRLEGFNFPDFRRIMK